MAKVEVLQQNMNLAESQLFNICLTGDISIVENLFEDKVYVTPYEWRHSLGMVCQNNHIEILKLLIDISEDAPNNDLWNEALLGGVNSGNRDIVKLILKQQPTNINQALYHACVNNNFPIIQLLTNGDFDSNAGFLGACHGGHLPLIKSMIKRGNIDINMGLELACYSGNIKCIDYLISQGANKWNKGLIGSCYGKHLDISKKMIENGANNLKEVFLITCNIQNGELLKYLSYKIREWKFILPLISKNLNDEFIKFIQTHLSFKLKFQNICKFSGCDTCQFLIKHGIAKCNKHK